MDPADSCLRSKENALFETKLVSSSHFKREECGYKKRSFEMEITKSKPPKITAKIRVGSSSIEYREKFWNRLTVGADRWRYIGVSPDNTGQLWLRVSSLAFSNSNVLSRINLSSMKEREKEFESISLIPDNCAIWKKGKKR